MWSVNVRKAVDAEVRSGAMTLDCQVPLFVDTSLDCLLSSEYPSLRLFRMVGNWIGKKIIHVCA